MDRSLEHLLRLQGIDSELEGISREQSAVPEEIMAIEETMREAESMYQQEKERLAALNKRRASLENDLVLSNERLKKYQTQLFSAKTNEEYQAFLREIDGTKQSISKNEEDILALMEDGERMTAEISVKGAQLEKEKTESKREIEALRERLTLLAEQYKEKMAERQTLVAGMGSRLVTKYERIKNGRGGRAVIAISGEVCGGCHTTLPPQFAAEIRKGEEIITCENCGRILIWEERK